MLLHYLGKLKIQIHINCSISTFRELRSKTERLVVVVMWLTIMQRLYWRCCDDRCNNTPRSDCVTRVHKVNDHFWSCYSAPVRMRSIVINPSVRLPVCRCVFVCPRAYLWNHWTGPILTKFCAHIPCGRGLVLLRRRYATLCTSGFMDYVTFGRNVSSDSIGAIEMLYYYYYYFIIIIKVVSIQRRRSIMWCVYAVYKFLLYYFSGF